MVRSFAGFAALAILALASLGGTAAAQDPPRAELLIRAVTLSNGALRYGVTIRIGGKTLDAALDTGSTGLRVLPGVLGPGDAAGGTEPEAYGYASGSRYEGVAGEAQVTLGAITAKAPVHLIRSIGCFAQYPHCPASRTPPCHDYGIASDGLPDEGYKAILGTDMAAARVGNPLIATWACGAGSSSCPGPARRPQGALILNPSPAELAGYTLLPLAAPYAQIQGGGLHDALPGCLVHVATKARVCGPVLMDTGSSFLSVINARRGAAWPDGSQASLELFDTSGAVAVRHVLTLGSRDQATRLTWRDEPRAPGVMVFAGVAPYFAYSVLCDARRQLIGMKLRQPVAGGEAER